MHHADTTPEPFGRWPRDARSAEQHALFLFLLINTKVKVLSYMQWSELVVACCRFAAIHAGGVDLDDRTLERMREFLWCYELAPNPLETTVRSYDADLVAHRTIMHHVLIRGANEPVTRTPAVRKRTACRLLLDSEINGDSPWLETYGDLPIARRLLQRWPQPDAPPVNTLRLDLRDLRHDLQDIARIYGTPSPGLFTSRAPTEGLKAKNGPVQGAIERVDAHTPIITLTPWVLRQSLEHLVRTLWWSQVRPIDKRGRLNPRFQGIIEARVVAFETRARAFCLAEQRFIGASHRRCADLMFWIFTLHMYLAVYSPSGHDRAERLAALLQHHQELRALLDLGDDFDIGSA